jgi:hypothetical protein
MPAYLSEWFGAMDVVVMQLIMEFTGMNDLLRQAIAIFDLVYAAYAEGESR